MATPNTPISEVVRVALERAIERESQRELARRTGIDDAVLYRFREGGEVRTGTLDRLAAALGIVAVQRKPKGGKR